MDSVKSLLSLGKAMSRSMSREPRLTESRLALVSMPPSPFPCCSACVLGLRLLQREARCSDAEHGSSIPEQSTSCSGYDTNCHTQSRYRFESSDACSMGGFLSPDAICADYGESMVVHSGREEPLDLKVGVEKGRWTDTHAPRDVCVPAF